MSIKLLPAFGRLLPAEAVAPLATAIMVMASAGTRDAAAQDSIAPRHRIPITDSVYTRVTTFSPRSGPPGTAVVVRTSSLPAVTPVQIAIGGTRSGFEVLSQLMTSRHGEISDTVSIPTWTEQEGTYLFIVLDMYFKPLAASEIFYVTGPDGTVLRTGRIAEVGTCPKLRGDDGELYTLVGRTGRLKRGDQVIVEGKFIRSSPCTQGTAIDVVRIRPGTTGQGL